MSSSHPLFLAPDDQGLAQAADILQRGGIVALPTESSFGLAAAIDRPEALDRIGRIKQRSEASPFLVLVSSRDEAQRLIGRLSQAAGEMAGQHWPGPLTLVARPLEKLHPSLVSKLGVGVRLPGHPVARRLVELTGCPLTATSANISGQPPAATPQEAAGLSGIDAVIDAPAQGRPPSTVAAVRAWGLQVLRQGPAQIPRRLQITEDTIFHGAVTLFQPAEGYRFSVDALLLAAFGAKLVTGDDRLAHKGLLSAADLGTGNGVVALALWHLLRNGGSKGAVRLRMWGLELQSRLAELARLNVAEAGRQAGEVIQILEQDLTERINVPPPGRLDLVLSNPPYRKEGSGRPSPDRERRVALVEESVDIAAVAQAAGRLLRPGGLAAFVYPAARMADLFSALQAAKLRPTLLRPLLPHAGRSAHRVLVAAVKGRLDTPLRIDPPMVLHLPDGTDSPALADILAGRVLP